MINQHVNKELVMIKEDNEDSKNSTKCWVCDNDYDDNDVKVRCHYHISRKCRGSVQRDCDINVKLNHKNPIVFHNLNSFSSYYARTKQIQF